MSEMCLCETSIIHKLVVPNVYQSDIQWTWYYSKQIKFQIPNNDILKHKEFLELSSDIYSHYLNIIFKFNKVVIGEH